MKRTQILKLAAIAAVFAIPGVMAIAAQDKYAVKVPGGLAFAEFRGYEGWQVVSASLDGDLLAVTLANPVMIEAYRAGIPGNGKAVPDGPGWRRSTGIRKSSRRSPQPRCRGPCTTSISW